jgi:hypothetical protein
MRNYDGVNGRTVGPPFAEVVIVSISMQHKGEELMRTLRDMRRMLTICVVFIIVFALPVFSLYAEQSTATAVFGVY